MTSIKDLDP